MTKLNGTKIVFALCLILILFTPYAADAYLNVDYPRIPVPGGSLDINKAVELNRVTIGTVSVFIYVIAIWLAGVVAFVSLIYAGILYIMSGANPGARSKANKHLAAVAWGIGIVLFSFWMLFMINPDVINLRVSQPPPLAGDPGIPLVDFNYRSGNTCRGTFSCEWTGDECVVDEEKTSCGLGCTARDDCETANELSNQDEAQEACESLINLSCVQESDGISGGQLGVICLSEFFTDTVWFPDDNTCMWNSGLVVEEAEGFCNWCEDEEGGLCMTRDGDQDTRRCSFGDDSVTVAENSSSCFWQASRIGGACTEVENCDDGYKSDVVCSAFSDDEDLCSSTGLKDVPCVEEDDGGDDPATAGTFECNFGGTTQCVAVGALDNCEDGYVPDTDICSSMSIQECSDQAETEYTCIKAAP